MVKHLLLSSVVGILSFLALSFADLGVLLSLAIAFAAVGYISISFSYENLRKVRAPVSGTIGDGAVTDTIDLQASQPTEAAPQAQVLADER